MDTLKYMGCEKWHQQMFSTMLKLQDNGVPERFWVLMCTSSNNNDNAVYFFELTRMNVEEISNEFASSLVPDLDFSVVNIVDAVKMLQDSNFISCNSQELRRIYEKLLTPRWKKSFDVLKRIVWTLLEGSSTIFWGVLALIALVIIIPPILFYRYVIRPVINFVVHFRFLNVVRSILSVFGLKSNKKDVEVQVSLVLHPQMECLCCISSPKNILFEPCNHLLACSTCAKKLPWCPVCHSKIVRCREVYL